ncbi:MAG TPA: diguanylate cyclase, partial [Thermomicrobiales bacterium]
GDVLTAASGAQAFELLGLADDSNPAAIDLILMDLMLPDTDGIAAIRALAMRERLGTIPVIMVTAMQDNETLRGAFEVGATDYITKPINEVELLARVGAALRLKHEIDRRAARERELIEVTRQLEAANERLQQISLTDGLTGLANRRHFDQVLRREWNRALRNRSPLALILADVDHFKRFNDTYGHQEGDGCLTAVAEALGECANRSSDLAARYGGEEFALILPGTDIEGARAVGERLLTNVTARAIPHRASSVGPIVSISAGVASVIPDEKLSTSALIAAADQALYQAKEAGRGRLMLHALH